VRFPLWRRRQDDDLDEEIRRHLEMAARDRVERGERSDQAASAARREFGNIGMIKEVTREMWGWGTVDRLLQDTRFGLRLLRKNPAFTAAAVLSLAIGIGALTTVFAIINAVELKPLPVRAPGDLVYMKHPSFSYPIFREVQARGQMFDGVFAWQMRDLNVRWSDDTESVPTLLASGGFYSTLGVRPQLGRGFVPEDDVAGAARPVVVLSHATWLRRFGGDPGAVGRTITIENVPFTIIGVEPPEFFGVAVGAAPEITIPVTMFAQLRAEMRDALRQTSRSWLHIMGRLRPGWSRTQADAAFQVIWPQALAATASPTLSPARRARYLARDTALMPGATGFSSVRNQFSEPLWLLLALVALLLLVACAAVANLLLARGCVRQRELAVRVAIGASGGRLVRQLLVEGLWLSLLGSAVGLIVAAWSARVLIGFLSTRAAPVTLDLTLDWRVFGFTAIAACLVALLFTVAPALKAVRVAPGDAIKSGRQMGTGPRQSRAANLLVASQIGFSLLLVFGAALFLRSLGTLMAVDSGVDPVNLLIVSVDPPAGADREAFYRELVRQLRDVSGVKSASLSWVPPISDDMGGWNQAIGIDGAEPPDGAVEDVFFNAVSPGYFETVGTRLVAGRGFDWRDGRSAARVAVVNETLSRTRFRGQSPIGRRFTMNRGAQRRDIEIVGVVGDAKYQRLQETTLEIAYLPHEQVEFIATNNLVAEVRTAGASARVSGSIREVTRRLSPASPIAITPLDDRIRDSLVRERLVALVAALLGAFALVLSCGALYGLMSHTVARRTNEIGIRIALGASRAAVLRLIVADTLRIAAGGALVGLMLVAGGSRIAQRFLFGISAMDPTALAAATSLVLATALVAGYLPARRASTVDPTVALRSE